MYGRILGGLMTCALVGYGLLVTALVVSENRILLRPGTDPRGKQFYLNRFQSYCQHLQCHTCPSGALCFELQNDTEQKSTDQNNTANQNDTEQNSTEHKTEKTNSRKSILLCHGNAGTALDFEPLLDKFATIYDTIYVVEYRGYGCSKSQPSVSPANLVDDLTEVVQLLESSNRAPVNVLLGYSIGGGVVSQWLTNLKDNTHLKQIVILNSFASIPQLVDEHVPMFSGPIKSAMQCQWNSAKALKRVLNQHPTLSLLWVSTLDDRLIGQNHTKTVKRTLEGLPNVEYVELHNGNHAASIFVHSPDWMSKLQS
jgi:hypothetical protein